MASPHSQSLTSPPISNPREILIIQTAFLGDLLLSFPLIKELKRRYPESKITVLCRYRLGAMLLKSGLVARVVEVDKSGRGAWSKAVRELKTRTYDLALCPHESVRSALVLFRLRGCVARSIGFAHFWNALFFTERVERVMDLPEALRQMRLLAPLDSATQAGSQQTTSIDERIRHYRASQVRPGGQAEDGLLPVPDWASMALERLVYVREAYRERREIGALAPSVKALIKEWNLGARPIAALAPGSVWATKRWTEEGYRAVAERLVAAGYDVLIHGAPDERAVGLGVADGLEHVRVVAGKLGIWESAEMLALSDLVICNDSGAMHMAACAAVPTVAIFGPTVLEFGYRPWNNEASVVQTDLDCRPCGAHGPQKCPIGTHACMKDISADLVFETAHSIGHGQSEARTRS